MEFEGLSFSAKGGSGEVDQSSSIYEISDFEFVDEYLERIDVPMLPKVDPDGLTLLQTAHLKHVPFENLDIINGNVPLSLDEYDLWDKIVKRKRGGICYEQNILFAAVLEKLGFSVRRMASHHPLHGKNEFDHMFLMVDFPKRDETWISDVGYSHNNFAPIKFLPHVWQSDLRDMLKVDSIVEGKYLLIRRNSLGEEEAMYEFNLISHTNEEYRSRCDYFSTSPDSFFNQAPFVSMDTLGGRKLLTPKHFRTYMEGEVVTRDLSSREEFDELLKEEFGIVL